MVITEAFDRFSPSGTDTGMPIEVVAPGDRAAVELPTDEISAQLRLIGLVVIESIRYESVSYTHLTLPTILLV